MSSTTVLRDQRRPTALLLLLVGLFLALLGIFGGATVSHAAPATNPTDTILVKFKAGASDQAIAALNGSNAVTEVDAIPALGIRVLRVPATKSAATVAAAYAKNPLVQFAEVNARVAPEAIPNDPGYGSAWHLPKINAPAAWDSAKATGVLVTVCDTGVEGTHPDLQPILRADLGWNAVSNSSDWSPIAGHGTLVSGALAAATNNSIGVSGVAWGANIIPVRISNQTDGSAYVSDAAKCVQYGADKGARAINISYRMASYASLDTAGAYARTKGALTFVAAGNDGIDPGWSDLPNFIAVAGTTDTDTRASWSNYGTYIDIAAPGTNIRTTALGGGYIGAAGTSLASPVAAGVAALIFGANPGLSAGAAESILRQSADDIGDPGEDTYFGSGRVNASKAVALALGGSSTPPSDTTAPTASISSPSGGSTVSGTVTVAASASDNVGVTKVEFFVDGVLKATDTASPWSFSWDTTGVVNGSRTVTSRASDAAGNAATSAAVSVTVQNTVADTTAPSVVLSSPSATVSTAGTVTISASATDNVAVARVEFYVDGALLATDTASPYDAPWNTSSVPNGSHTLTAKAYDTAGNSATSAPVTVNVQNAATLVTDTFTGSIGGRNKPTSITHTVKVNASGTMSLNLTWGGKANLDFTVYNAAGQVVAVGTASGTKSEAASFTAAAGTYTVVVKAVTGGASYTLTATRY